MNSVKFPGRKTIEKIRSEYPTGTRIMLLRMDDPYSTLEAGTCGTVQMVDDIGTIHVQWDNGSTLGVVYGVDECKIITQD